MLLPAETAIAKLCAYEPVCQALFDLGAVTMLVDILVKYPKDSEIILVTCSILNMCAQNINFIAVVSKFPIVELVLKCVAAMKGYPEVLCTLLCTLFFLVDQSAELAAVFKSNRGPEVVSSVWSEWEKDEEVVYAVLHCVTAFAGDADIQPRLSTLKYIERIAEAMAAMSESKHVLREAMTRWRAWR